MRRQLRQAAAGLISPTAGDDVEDGGAPGGPGTTAAADATATSAARKDNDKEDSELRMQLDSAEYEVDSRHVHVARAPLYLLTSS